MSEHEQTDEYVLKPWAIIVTRDGRHLGDYHATTAELNILARDNAALVRVVENLLQAIPSNSVHLTYCPRWGRPAIQPSAASCTCGADEARTLLAKIRGRG